MLFFDNMETGINVCSNLAENVTKNHGSGTPFISNSKKRFSKTLNEIIMIIGITTPK
jgi:hypothetical protein